MSEKINKHRVIVIGAGFSISAGIPPQKELVTEIDKINAEEPTSSYTTIEDDQKTLDYFLKSLYGDNFLSKNIFLEDIYTMMDTAISRHRNIGIFKPPSLFQIKEALDRLILYIVNKEISPTDITLYGNKVSSLMDSSDTTFISLNWDFLLERVLIDLDYTIDYGFPLDPTYKPPDGKQRITVLKPHGSLNWRLCPTCERIYGFMKQASISHISQCEKCREIYDSQAGIIDSFEALGLGFSFNQRLLPLLVSPTFLKNHSIPQLNIISQKMHSSLAKADELVFIGYSLPVSDHDIRDQLIKACSIKPKDVVKVILKPSSLNEREQLKSHYNSIFHDSKPEFQWNGF